MENVSLLDWATDKSLNLPIQNFMQVFRPSTTKKARKQVVKENEIYTILCTQCERMCDGTPCSDENCEW